MSAVSETAFPHDGPSLVVRAGDTVRRPARPFSATVQHYLAHVRSRGFVDCPEPLGLDDKGREVLSYVPGQVPVDPLPADVAGTEVLIALGSLVRRLHDAADGWAPPPGAVFGDIPGALHGSGPGARPVPPPRGAEAGEIVAHQDYCPGNVVFRDGLPAALIDFDLCRPTSRVGDLVNAIAWWVPLAAPSDRPPAFVNLDAATRTRVLVDAYGLDAESRALVVPVARWRVEANLVGMKAAAQVDPLFRRWWDEGLGERLLRTRDWLATEAPHLHAVLLA